MARHTIRARLSILVLVVTFLQFWPVAQSQAQVRQPYLPASGSVAEPQRSSATFAADLAGSPSRNQRLGLDASATTAGLNPAATEAQEIAALAAGLENDPLAIYDYVHNHIDYVPSSGLLKGPRETLLSGEGTAYDQAVLLAALLNAAGYSTQYIRGEIALTNQQAMNWTGAADANAAINIFLAGRIQVTLVGGTIHIPHVWVRVSATGSHDLDPSFKSYSARAGQDLHPLLGFNPATFIDRAQSGATITASSTQHLNLANIQADVAGYAKNLVAYLRANMPFASVEDLIGGRQIVPIVSSSYPASPYDVINGAPGNLSDMTYALDIRVADITYSTTTDKLDGRRITVFYDCAAQIDCQTLQAGGGIFNVDPLDVQVIPKLRIGGQIVGTGAAVSLGTAQQLDIVVTPPASPQDFGFSRFLFAGGWYALPVRLGNTSSRSLARQLDLLDEALAQVPASDDEPVLGQLLHVLGLAYYNEVSVGGRIDSRLAKVVAVPYVSAMVASRDILVYEDSLTHVPVDIEPGGHTVDVGLSFTSVAPADSTPDDRKRAWFFSAGVRGSAAEHAIIEQLQPVPAVSTAQILKQAAADGQVLYYINSGNRNTILPLLGYSANTLNRIGDALDAGKEIVIPKNPVDYAQWHGTGWIELNRTTGEAGYIISGVVGAVEAARVLTINGGGAALPQPTTDVDRFRGATVPMQPRFAVEPRSPTYGAAGLPPLGPVPPPCPSCSQPPKKPNDEDQERSDKNASPDLGTLQQRLERPVDGRRNDHDSDLADPIDPTAGAFQYDQRDMASLGGRGIPLEFERFYTNLRHNLAGPLGYGWSHTYNTSFALGTEWARGFGARTAIEAAPALAAAQIGVDLFNTASIPQQRFAIDAIVGQWLMTQITGNAAVLTAPSGAVATYLRLSDGAYQAPARVANLNTVSIVGGIATLTWENGAQAQFSSAGRPIALIDANGNRTVLSYDDHGRLSQVADAVGRTLKFTYNAQNRVSQVADPASRLYRYTYDGQGNLGTATDPRNGVTTYAYDSAHQITGITDPVGAMYVINQYDTLGRVSVQTDGRGGQIRLLYGGDHTVVIDASSARTSYFYDQRDRLTAVEDSLGIRTSSAYDAADHTIVHTDGLGRTVRFAYDARGHLTTTTDALNKSTVWTYDAAGNPTRLTDQLGKIWQFAYDGRHNLTSAADPTGVTLQYTYNAQGQLTQARSASGATALSYDSYGNLASLRNAVGATSRWSYDIVGRLANFTDATGAVTRFSYDAGDNLIQVVAPGGGRASFAYDGNSNLTRATDPNGHSTSYTYDAQFSLTSVTDALGGISRYAYDANNRLVRVTNPKGSTTDYERDAAGRVVAIIDPLGRRTGLSYDATDRLIALQRPDGSSIGYTYDALGRQTGIDNPTGADAAFSYDPAGQMIAAAYGAAWSVSYQYDGAGRLSGIIEPGRSLTVSYSYDQAGRRAGLRVNRGAAALYNLAYSYDAADQLRAIVDSAANPSATISLSYDLAGRLAQIADPSGASARYFYTAGSLIRVSHLPSQGGDIATYDYTYDAAGNIVSVSDRTPAGAFVTSYAYDALDRLTQETYARYKIAYTYDAAGNLTRRVDPLGALDYSYDSADQLLARGGESFGYDLNGNLTSWQSARGASTYSYDHQNHLTGLTRTDGATMAFSYDAFGRRLTLQEPSGTRGFLYDGTDTIVIGSGDLGQMAARYLHGGDRLLARYTDQLGVSMYHGDAFDNVRYLVGSAGQPLDGYDYDAFGRAGAPGGIDANPFRFFGQRGVYQHDIVGWPGLQMGQRYYDPQGARFITRDPLPGSLHRPNSQNRYAYGLNNPLSFGDACGLRPKKYRPSVEANMTGAKLNAADQPLPQAGDLVVPPDQRPGQPEATDDFPCGQGGALSDLSADDLGQPPGFDGADAASADWQQLTGQGGSYALTCTANDRLLAGSFYAGLQLSATSGHAMWGSVSLAGVDEIAISGNTYYAGARYGGVLKSGDAGNSWAPAVDGLAANHVYALAIDPGASNRVYAGTEMGLFVSQNGGATWGRPAGAVPGRVVSELAFAGSALLAITDMGLFRSTNAGSTWQRPGRDLPAVQVYTLLAGQPAGTVYAGTAIGAYISNDSGNTWSPLGTGLAGRAVHALAIDPLNGQHILAGTTLGLFVSTDRGVTWKPDARAGLGGASSQIGALAFCSGGGDLNLYLGTGSGVYGVMSARPRASLPIIRAP